MTRHTVAGRRSSRGRTARVVSGIGAERLEDRVNLSSASVVPAPMPSLDDQSAPAVLAAAAGQPQPAGVRAVSAALPMAAAVQARGRVAPRTFVPPSVGGIAEISGNITRDTTFVAGTVYVITGEVHVWRYKTLTIEDGVEVRIRNGRGQFAHLTSRALIFDSGSSLVAKSVRFQAANDKNEPVAVADNGGVFFCGGTRAASKDNVSSEVLGQQPRWSFQATTIAANYLGRNDPAGGDGDGPTLDDIDAVSLVGVIESEWKVASVKSRFSGDDGFDLTNSNVVMQSVRVINPTEDGVNLSSSNLRVEKSLVVDMTDKETPRDREIFDFEVDAGSNMITVYVGAEVTIRGYWDNTPFDQRIYLESKDMEQPKPLERAWYAWSGTLKRGSAFIYTAYPKPAAT